MSFKILLLDKAFAAVDVNVVKQSLWISQPVLSCVPWNHFKYCRLLIWIIYLVFFYSWHKLSLLKYLTECTYFLTTYEPYRKKKRASKRPKLKRTSLATLLGWICTLTFHWQSFSNHSKNCRDNRRNRIICTIITY